MLSFVFIPALSGAGQAALYRSIVHELKRAAPHVKDGMEFICGEDFSEDRDAAHVSAAVAIAPTRESIVHARARRARLIGRGVPPGRILCLLVDERLPAGLPTTVVREQIGELTAVLPYDPYFVTRIENEGTTFQNVKPKSAAAKAVKTLAAALLAPPGSVENARPQEWAVSLEKRAIEHIWSALARADHVRSASNAQLEALIENEFTAALAALNGHHSRDVIDAARQNVKDHVMGLGPLQKIMRDPLITEVMVNGEADIYVERDGRVHKTPEAFSSRAQLLTVIDRVVSSGGRRVDTSSPLCDARLPDGSRVNVVLPPVSLAGPLLTIRRFRENMLSLDDLAKKGTLSAADGRKLVECVCARKNIVVAGNSGSGKTTLLNILSSFINPSERIITIEDSAELKLQQPHVVRLETRSKNADGIGAIGVSDLVVNALRMRPDRLIVGECRGAEVIPMLQAMNTGHDGSMTTIHANSAADALNRLESMVLIGAPQWPVEVAREQIRRAIDVIVYLKREGPRRVLQEIRDVEELV